MADLDHTRVLDIRFHVTPGGIGQEFVSLRHRCPLTLTFGTSSWQPTGYLRFMKSTDILWYAATGPSGIMCTFCSNIGTHRVGFRWYPFLVAFKLQFSLCSCAHEARAGSISFLLALVRKRGGLSRLSPALCSHLDWVNVAPHKPPTDVSMELSSRLTSLRSNDSSIRAKDHPLRTASLITLFIIRGSPLHNLPHLFMPG